MTGIVEADGHLDPVAVLNIAQQSGLLTNASPVVFTPAAIAQPMAIAHNFAQAISNSVAQQKQLESQQHEAEQDQVLNPLALVQRIEHLLDVAKDAGLTFTVGPNATGTLVPTVSKIAS